MEFAVIGFLRRLLPATIPLMLVSPACADTVADTARQWGLIGPWSLDCSLPPDHARGAVLSYDIADGNRLMYRRDFGDAQDEAEVLSATVSGDGTLNLRVYFPSLKQTREYGMKRRDDGSIRSVYNRNDQNQYSIRYGKFTASGKPTPAQHKCDERPE